MSVARASAHMVAGAAWVFGDEINTDAMAPGLYFKESMDVMAQHCLETINPDFAPNVQPGDVVVGGRNFGVGSAREQAPMALQHLGVGAIIAVSFSRIFYRNAINFGLPVLQLAEATEISTGDLLCIDPVSGLIENRSSDKRYDVEPIPPHMMAMIAAGGLMPWLKERVANGSIGPNAN